ncbi:hypothetical protein M9H77_17499 [Catharanthus roseus]|uniref:Uncharacterized protein n=1 Tax=Catharanthus roseus TaxID=4058 RepID=A0ACC0B4S9_CATRO|nr:hypothetical protein M9H77_17499 [Catharanthus roseus]
MAHILGERSLAFLIILECLVFGGGWIPTLRITSLYFHASSLKIMRELEPKYKLFCQRRVVNATYRNHPIPPWTREKVIQSGKGGIRGSVLGELGSAMRALFEEAEVVIFLGIVTNGGEGRECNKWNQHKTQHEG